MLFSIKEGLSGPGPPGILSTRDLEVQGPLALSFLRHHEQSQFPGSPRGKGPGTSSLLSPLGPTSSEQIMKTGALLLQG